MAPTLPDVQRLLSAALRATPAVTAIAGDRVYTAFPAQLDEHEPFVLLQRIGGAPAVVRPLVVDIASIQLDAYGGGQALAHELVAACRAELAQLQGEQPDDAGNVCAVICGALRYVPDEAFKPARPRYVADLEVTVKPAAKVLAAGAARAPALAGATRAGGGPL